MLRVVNFGDVEERGRDRGGRKRRGGFEAYLV